MKQFFLSEIWLRFFCYTNDFNNIFTYKNLCSFVLFFFFNRKSFKKKASPLLSSSSSSSVLLLPTSPSSSVYSIPSSLLLPPSLSHWHHLYFYCHLHNHDCQLCHDDCHHDSLSLHHNIFHFFYFTLLIWQLTLMLTRIISGDFIFPAARRTTLEESSHFFLL